VEVDVEVPEVDTEVDEKSYTVEMALGGCV
jgi:hypothetical protein